MSEYRNARDIVKQRILDKYSPVFRDNGECYSDEVNDKYGDMNTNSAKLNSYIKSNLRTLYHLLNLIFDTFEPEKKENDENVDIKNRHHTTPHFNPIIEEFRDESSFEWLDSCYDSLTYVIRVMALASNIFLAYISTKGDLKSSEFYSIKKTFSDIKELILKCSTKEDFDNIVKRTKELYKKYSSKDLSEYMNGTSKRKINIEIFFSWDTKVTSGYNLYLSYELLGKADDFIKNSKLISFLYNKCFKYVKSKNDKKYIKTRKITDDESFKTYYELVQDFKSTYNFYHRLIVNYEPYLGQLNTIEEDFINYLLDTFGENEINTSEKPNRKKDHNKNEAIYNSMKVEDWTKVPLEVRHNILEFIENITFCEHIEHEDQSEEKNYDTDGFDYSEIKKHLHGMCEEELHEKLSNVKSTLETTDWTNVPFKARVEILTFIEKIIFKDQNDSQHQNNYDFTRINKYMKVNSVDAIYEKLNNIRSMLESPKVYLIKKHLREIEESLQFRNIDDVLFDSVIHSLLDAEGKLNKESNDHEIKDEVHNNYIDQINKLLL